MTAQTMLDSWIVVAILALLPIVFLIVIFGLLVAVASVVPRIR